MPVKESTIVKQIRTYLESEGWATFKIHGGAFQQVGLPDLLAFKNDFPAMAIEVKRPGGKATPLQQATLNKLSAAGVIAFVADSVSDVKAVLEIYRLRVLLGTAS